jgi:hypothetical protein
MLERRVLILGILIFQFVCASCSASENGLKDWVKLPLSVFPATRDRILSLPAINAPSEFEVSVLVAPGSPRGISFTPDGQTMLIGAAVQSPENPVITQPGKGRILQVSPDGSVADKPYVSGLHEPGAMAFAPPDFGDFGGDLFISDAGSWDNDIPATSPIASDGRLYRVTSHRELVPFVDGLLNPVAVAFAGGKLVLTDINGDFHVGQHKIPIGFIITIEPRVLK